AGVYSPVSSGVDGAQQMPRSPGSVAPARVRGNRPFPPDSMRAAEPPLRGSVERGGRERDSRHAVSCRRQAAPRQIGDNVQMPINLKTPAEIERMRIAGRLAAEVLQIVAPHVKPGVTTEELDRICHDHIINVQGAVPANVGYKGFPKTVCTSVNNVICHGIPAE